MGIPTVRNGEQKLIDSKFGQLFGIGVISVINIFWFVRFFLTGDEPNLPARLIIFFIELFGIILVIYYTIKLDRESQSFSSGSSK